MYGRQLEQRQRRPHAKVSRFRPLPPEPGTLACGRGRSVSACAYHNGPDANRELESTGKRTRTTSPTVCTPANSSPTTQRNLPARGFRPATLLGAAGVVMIYGWYKLTLGIREQKYVCLPFLLPVSTIPPPFTTNPAPPLPSPLSTSRPHTIQPDAVASETSSFANT